jgi:hypothetical protein
MAPYITVADVRAAGLPDTVVGDDAVTAAILLWQDVIERYCRQWFEPRDLDLRIDGTDSDTLHLGIPIIEVEELYMNDGTTPIDSTLYKVYNNRSGYPDDRKNPRIKLRSMYDYADIFTAPIMAGQLKFRKGRQNQRIVGTFGYTEADDTAPLAIKRALTKLVIRKATQPMYIAPGVVPPAPPPLLSSSIVTEEWTDGHRIVYANNVASSPRRADNMSEVIDDPEVRGILKLYRAPIAMAAPANPSYSG